MQKSHNLPLCCRNSAIKIEILHWLLYLLLALSVGFGGNAAAQNATLAKSTNTPLDWLQHDLRLNGIGVGIENAQKIVFVPLGVGFDKPTDYDVKLAYRQSILGYRFSINGTVIDNGGRFRFVGLQYGASIPVQRYQNGVLIDTYTLLFTNLPVIQINAPNIVDTPKSPGTFRLLSGQFQQDTGVLRMGIEFRGMGTQRYEKKSLSVQIGKVIDWKQAADVRLLDLNKDNDWILDAVYVDTSFFRNLVSEDIFRAIRPGAYFDVKGVLRGQASLRGHLTEVIKNGRYDGVYSLNEKPSRKMYGLQKITVPVDSQGVSQWGQVDFNDPNNGSVIYKAGVFDNVFFEAQSVKTNFEQVYPKLIEADRWQPLVDFANFVATSSDQAFAEGIAQHIDLDSVVDWWCLVLASHAEDNIRHNFNLARSGSGKFYMLAWDHEGSFGVRWFSFKPETNNLIRRLQTLPAAGFNAKLKTRWQQLRASELSQKKMVARFIAYRGASDKGGARARDIVRWPQADIDQYMGSVKYINRYLADWLPRADKMVSDLPDK